MIIMKNGIIGKIISFSKEYSPELLIGSGVAAMITSTILAVKATPKAMHQIEDTKEDKEDDMLRPKDVVKATWKTYLPSVITGVAGVVCIITGTAQNTRKRAALAAVYSMSESTLRQYKDEVRKMVGDEKADELDKQAAKSKMKENAVIIDRDDSEYIEQTGFGQTLCYDSLSGRYFRSSVNAIDKAVNNFNRLLIGENYATLNDLYNELGISTIELGRILGWRIEDEMCDIQYDGAVDENGQPYIVIYYRNNPQML